ncbi:MAG: hypothetical protein AB1758_33515, partial [Candidatus Eremiobacterota bacterium]
TPASCVTSLAAHQGRCLAGGSSGELTEACSRGMVTLSSGDRSVSVLHASDQGLWVGRCDGSVERRDLQGNLLRRIAGRGNPVCALLADRHLWVGHGDGSVVKRHKESLARRAGPGRVHRGPVHALARIGDRLVSGGGDALIPHPPGQVSGHTGFLEAVAFSPDGRHLVSASYDETLRSFDVCTGAKQAVFRGHSGPVRTVVHAGDLVASGGKDGTVRLWATDGTALHRHATGWKVSSEIEGPGPWSRLIEPVSVLTLHGRLLLWAGDANVVTGFDLEERTARHLFEVSGGSVEALEFSPDGTRLLVGSDHRAQVRRTSDWSLLAEVDRFYGHFCVAAWRPDGELGAVADWNGRVHLFDGSGQVTTRQLPGRFLAGLAFDGRGRMVSLTHEEPTAFLRCWEGTREVERCEVSSSPGCLALHGETVAVGRSDGLVELFHLT